MPMESSFRVSVGNMTPSTMYKKQTEFNSTYGVKNNTIMNKVNKSHDFHGTVAGKTAPKMGKFEQELFS